MPLLDPPDTHVQRAAMVATQLVWGGIVDQRVLRAMGQVPREAFVTPGLEPYAYGDHPLPIGQGQTISQPYMVALMAERLQLQGDERVLEIGAGSGYSAAVLSLLAREVVTIERLAPLLEQAKQCWQRLGLDNIEGMVGDGTLGHAAGAPYDAIVVTAGAPHVPSRLIEQLRPGSGRMVIPVGDRNLQHLLIIRRALDGLATQERDTACVFVPLVGEDGWRYEN